MNNTARQLQIIGGVISSGVTGATGQFIYTYEPETRIIETKQEIIEQTFDTTATIITGEAINPTILEYVPPLTNFIAGNEVKPIVEEIRIPKASYLDGQETITPISFEVPSNEVKITMPPANEIIEAQTPITMISNTTMPEIKEESSITDILIEEDTIKAPIIESNIIDLNYYSELDENSIWFAIAEDSLKTTEMETTVIKPFFMQLASLQGETIIETTTNTNSLEIVSTSNLIELDYYSSKNTLKDIFKEFTDAKLNVSGWYLSDVNGLTIENEEWVTSLDEKIALAITFKNSSDEKSHWLISHSEGIDWEKVKSINDIFEKYGISEAK